MTIRGVVAADEHDRWDGKTWIVRWDGGDSTAMTEEEADQLAAGVSQVAALRAELETAEALRKSANAEIARLAAELETARAGLIARCHCRCHVADSGVPPCGSCEKCEEGLEEEREALETSALRIMGERSRAVAIEEAARKFGQYMEEGWRVATALTAIRGLAPLDPALVVVAKEEYEALRSDLGCERSRATLFERQRDTARAHVLREVRLALVEVAKLDYPQGGAVENIVCMVLEKALVRIAALKALEEGR